MAALRRLGEGFQKWLHEPTTFRLLEDEQERTKAERERTKVANEKAEQLERQLAMVRRLNRSRQPRHHARPPQSTQPTEGNVQMDQHMRAALEEARRGAQEGGIPIGAALVDAEGKLVATGRNRRVQDRTVAMHAEINVLYNAGRTVENFRGMTMYSTLMPCNMCAGAAVQFGISMVIVGESENFRDNGLDLMLRHGVEVVDLDLDEAKELLARFIETHPAEWYGGIGLLDTRIP